MVYTAWKGDDECNNPSAKFGNDVREEIIE